MNLTSNRSRIVGLGVVLILLLAGFFFISSQNKVDAPVTTPDQSQVSAPSPVPLSPSPSEQTPVAAPVASTTAPTQELDPQGHVLKATFPDGSTYVYQYDSKTGDRIRATNQNGKVWTFLYNQNHTVIRTIDSQGRPSNVSPGQTVNLDNPQ